SVALLAMSPPVIVTILATRSSLRPSTTFLASAGSCSSVPNRWTSRPRASLGAAVVEVVLAAVSVVVDLDASPPLARGDEPPHAATVTATATSATTIAPQILIGQS